MVWQFCHACKHKVFSGVSQRCRGCSKVMESPQDPDQPFRIWGSDEFEEEKLMKRTFRIMKWVVDTAVTMGPVMPLPPRDWIYQPGGR
jgi:hypothetical protein